ncbi:MAG TPA: glycine oxidase ThiO [Polyangiales bacterium]|nr:glycine oxidase ThiO [Polyangiales bacterium]
MSPDVIVVGGGLMGCTVARRLAKDGASVLVLERSVPGAEASSAAAGILGPTVESFDDALALQLGRRSRELHAELSDELDELFGIDVGFRRCGVIKVALDEAELGELDVQASRLDVQGVRCMRWSREELLQEEPAANPESAGALSIPEDAQVEPKKLLSAVAIGAEHEGVTFRTGSSVREVEVSSGRARGVRLDEETIEAERVVVAAGSWTTLIPGLPMPAKTIYPVRGQMVSTHTRPPVFRRVVFGAGGYVVTRPDGRVLCGSTMERVGFERGITFGGMADVIRKAIRIAPRLAAAPIDGHWSSFRPGTPDGLPLVGETRIEGLFLASGHYRNGILLAPLTAELIADAMSGKAGSREAEALSPRRFEEA